MDEGRGGGRGDSDGIGIGNGLCTENNQNGTQILAVSIHT